MIHLARPTVRPVVNIVFNCKFALIMNVSRLSGSIERGYNLNTRQFYETL